MFCCSLTCSFSRLDFLRNWRKSRAGMSSSSPSETSAAAKPADAAAATAKKKKTAKGKETGKKNEPVQASSPDDAASKGRSKTKRRKTDEAASPPEKQAPPKQKTVLYPSGQAITAAKAQPGFSAYGIPQMQGKMPFDDKSLILPGGSAMPQNVLPNNQMLANFGTPTLGMQGLPSTFNSPQAQAPTMPTQPMEQDQTGWMYS